MAIGIEGEIPHLSLRAAGCWVVSHHLGRFNTHV